MVEAEMLAYIEPEGESATIPFERYLPLLAPGVVKQWFGHHAKPGEWVLEPIGASPAAVLELGETGARVLVAVNNPVTAFEISLLARAPAKSELEAMLGELSVQKKGGERLGSHIKNLYLSRCASCGSEVTVESFIWRKGESVPRAKNYHCPACGDEGEHPVVDSDLERLTAPERADKLHRAMALEKVPQGTRSARENLEELLYLYSPRPLYALFTLINKVEGMSLTTAKRALLDALLLSALDAGHSLWPAGEGTERPRVVNIPGEYFEHNLWLSMEKAVDLWSRRKKPVPLTRWPETPKANGICLFQGRMRDLLQQKSGVTPDSVVCVIPRPSQVFWSLSTLWTSWLWGKEQAVNFKNVLERQRFDWYWHANALQSALAPAARMVKPESKVFTLLPEPAPGFVSAAIEAGCTSSLQLSGLGWKDEQQPIQMEWITRPGGSEAKKVNLHRIIHEAIHDCLGEIGEPCRYLKLYTAVNQVLAENDAFPTSIPQLTYETASAIHGEIAKVFSDRKFLRRLVNSAQDVESGYWWLTQPEGCQASLADRVETEIVAWLQKGEPINANDLQRTMNARFPGFLTPPADLLLQCLKAYADFDVNRQLWKLRSNEEVEKRQQDLGESRELLADLATRIGLTAEGENPILWSEPAQPDQAVYRLYLSSSASISRISKEEAGGEQSVFLFPGSRSALLRFKIDRDPFLRETVSKGWHFLKFRALRELARRKDISRDLWDLFIDSDPISQEDATQLSMFL